MGDLDRFFTRPCDGGLQHAADRFVGVVLHCRVDRQPRAVGVRQGQFGIHRRRSDIDWTERPQSHRFEDPGIAVGHEGVAVGGILTGPAVSEVAPVDPVVPTVGQFHAVDILNGALGNHPDCQRVRLTGDEPRRHIERMTVVHTDDLGAVGDSVAVEPDIGAVVDTGEVQPVGPVVGGSGERGPIPPVLLVQLLGDFVEQVLADVEVRIYPGLLQDLQHRSRHPPHRNPRGVVVAGDRDRRTTGFQTRRRDQFPAFGQFDIRGGRWLRRGEHPVIGCTDQQEHHGEDLQKGLRHGAGGSLRWMRAEFGLRLIQ